MGGRSQARAEGHRRIPSRRMALRGFRKVVAPGRVYGMRIALLTNEVRKRKQFDGCRSKGGHP